MDGVLPSADFTTTRGIEGEVKEPHDESESESDDDDDEELEESDDEPGKVKYES